MTVETNSLSSLFSGVWAASLTSQELRLFVQCGQEEGNFPVPDHDANPKVGRLSPNTSLHYLLWEPGPNLPGLRNKEVHLDKTSSSSALQAYVSASLRNNQAKTASAQPKPPRRGTVDSTEKLGGREKEIW